VDVLFRSAASVFGPKVLAVVMTGMGQDGFRGAQRVREVGGTVLAQDEATSVVWGMPGFVANAGLAEQVLPLDEIGPAIVRKVAGAALGASSRG
jgi:two-component system chemotaxis response regulator CheB